MFYDHNEARENTERFPEEHFDIETYGIGDPISMDWRSLRLVFEQKDSKWI